MVTRLAASLALLLAVALTAPAARAARPLPSGSPRVAATMKLLRDLGAHDPYTRRHMARVGENARAVARELGLPVKDQQLARLAGGLHDIGKTCTPSCILAKPGDLTRRERRVMRRHAAQGERMIRRKLGGEGAMGVVARVAGAHHERFDGGGYPRGLAGEEIPLLARVVAVVDAYDALTSQRTYNRPHTPAQALSILRADAGTHFDPAVVTAFERVQARGGASSSRSAASSESLSSSAGTR